MTASKMNWRDLAKKFGACIFLLIDFSNRFCKIFGRNKLQTLNGDVFSQKNCMFPLKKMLFHNNILESKLCNFTF